MIKKLMAMFLAALVTGGLSFADTILFEDFEDATVTYTPSVADSIGDLPTTADYYGRVSIAGEHSDTDYLNYQGNSYYGAQDMNGALVPADTVILNWVGIDISTFNNLSLSLFIAEDDEGANEDWDSTSSFLIEYQFDAGGFNNLFAIEATGTNTEPLEDTDFDGTGDGTAITDTFAQFSSAIAGTGNALDIRVTLAGLNDGDEDIAFDNFLLTGDVVPEPATFALFGLGGLMLYFRRKK